MAAAAAHGIFAAATGGYTYMDRDRSRRHLAFIVAALARRCYVSWRHCRDWRRCMRPHHLVLTTRTARQHCRGGLPHFALLADGTRLFILTLKPHDSRTRPLAYTHTQLRLYADLVAGIIIIFSFAPPPTYTTHHHIMLRRLALARAASRYTHIRHLQPAHTHPAAFGWQKRDAGCCKTILRRCRIVLCASCPCPPAA